MNTLSSSGRHGLCARVCVLVLDRDGMGGCGGAMCSGKKRLPKKSKC